MGRCSFTDSRPGRVDRWPPSVTLVYNKGPSLPPVPSVQGSIIIRRRNIGIQPRQARDVTLEFLSVHNTDFWAVASIDITERSSQLALLNGVPSVQRPVDVSEKQSLFRVISSDERREPLAVLEDSPGPQHPHIFKPLWVEARVLEGENPKCVPLIQDQISWREVEVGENERQR